MRVRQFLEQGEMQMGIVSSGSWCVGVIVSGCVLLLGHALLPVAGAGERSGSQSVRAGHPHKVAPWARLSIGKRHRRYYVGGGAVSGGDRRDVRREGTWGWDYAPVWTRVRLRWSHGRRLQGGGGEYRSDGRTGLGGWPGLRLFR